jgi:hypothetical protein
MIRSLMLGLLLAAAVSAADAQISPQFPQTLPPSLPSAPPPLTVSPGPAQAPPLGEIVGSPGSSALAPRGVAPRTNNFGDKVERCIHYGGTQGVRPGDIPQYTRECVNAQ